MKVAIIYSGSRTGGGVDTYLTRLFEYSQKDVELTLLSLGEWGLTNKFQISNFKYRIFRGPWWNVFNLFRVASYLRKNNFDLLVSQSMVANFYARVASFLSSVPSLVTVHSDWRTDYAGYKKALFYLFDRFFRFQTKGYITVSEYLKNQLVSEGIDEKMVHVVYNGVLFPGDKVTNTNKRMANRGAVIGTLGRLHAVKNFEQLILAVAELKGKGIEVNLEIAGEGEERGRLERVIRENGLSKVVKLLGWQKDLKGLFSRWDVYVQPSITEGFGLAAVEAMLAGLPVVVTPGGALPELISDGKTGIMAKGFEAKDLAAALSRVLDKGSGSEKLAEEGRQMAKARFDIEKWAKETIAVYGMAAR